MQVKLYMLSSDLDNESSWILGRLSDLLLLLLP